MSILEINQTVNDANKYKCRNDLIIIIFNDKYVKYFRIFISILPRNSYLKTGIDEDSPLWIGAWWKGCVIVGVFLIFVSP